MTGERDPARFFERLARPMLDAPSPLAWKPPDLSPFTDAQRLRARQHWEARTAAEHQSMTVFAEMLARMPEAGLPVAVTVATTRLIQDEARHTELCARMAAACGGDGGLPSVAARRFDGSLDARLFLARWTLSMLCVGECVSVALLDVLCDAATDPTARAVLASIQRDERMHDAFGWALAEMVLPGLDADAREWVSGDLAMSLAHYERVNTGGLALHALASQIDDTDAPHNLGTASRVRFGRAFHARITSRVLPGLEALGIPAHAAWAHRHDADAG